MGNQRSSYIGFDRRLTVVRPSFDRRYSTVNFGELGIAFGDAGLFGFSDRKICGKEGHRHSVVVADFMESDGFYAVGFLVAETVGTGGLESYSEAFAG